MRNGPTLRAGLWPLVLAGLAPLGGCTHNYYYGALPGAVAPAGVVQYGNVCEVPTQVGGATGSSAVAQSLPTATPVIGAGKPPRVVVSEPLGSGGGSRSRYTWRPADPDGGLATTRVEGGLTDGTATR